MNTHGKVYNTQTEYKYRYQVFAQNSAKVDALNVESQQLKSSATFGMNGLADLTEEEFRVRLGYKQNGDMMVRNRPQLRNADMSAAPAAFDWCLSERKCTAVKDQGQCGSCWAFATTENIESVWDIAGHGLISMAPQEIVDCDKAMDGCNGGDPAQAYKFVAAEGGLDTEASYPYTARDGTCKFKPADVAAKIRGEADGYGGSETQMAANLAKTAPFSIIVDASRWQFYTGGILKSTQCGHSLDHAVIAAGYSITDKYWNVRNSWGASWGEKGYIRLEFDKNTCGITTEVLTATL
jgi:C1A family cysteine protease